MEIGRPKNLTIHLEGASFEVLPPASDELLDIREKCLADAAKSGLSDSKTGDLIGFETFKATVKSWNGVSLEGKAVSATAENKLILWRNHNNFCGQILTKAQLALADHRRALEKNSESTPD